jgi:hypothetical protein
MKGDTLVKNESKLTIALLILATVASAADPASARRALELRRQAAGVSTDAPAAQPAANTNPHGAPYGEWGARWWQWVFSLPAGNPATHPLLTAGAVDCSIGQSGDVWFLAGNISGGLTVRNCTVRAGKALFFPILNSWCDNVGFDAPSNLTLPQLQACAASFVDPAASLHALVDGTAVSLSQANRGVAAFQYRVPNADNLLQWYGAQVPGAGWPYGNTPVGTVVAPAASDGYWLMVEPLAPGTHTINFGGASVNSGYSLEVIYTITVL